MPHNNAPHFGGERFSLLEILLPNEKPQPGVAEVVGVNLKK